MAVDAVRLRSVYSWYTDAAQNVDLIRDRFKVGKSRVWIGVDASLITTFVVDDEPRLYGANDLLVGAPVSHDALPIAHDLHVPLT